MSPQEKEYFKDPSRLFWLHILVLASASLAIYLNTANNGFIYNWDDKEYVVDNIYIRGFSVENIKIILTTPFVSNFFPVQIFSYMFDYSIWKLNPAGYHLVNVFLHTANVILAYALIRKLTESAPLAFFAALGFAVHPINVEIVAWVSQRKMLLSAFFFFITMLFYLNGRSSGKYRFYIMAVFFYVCSVFSKTTTVAVPFLFIVYEIFGLPPEGRRTGLSKDRGYLLIVPFFLVAVSGAAGSVWASLAGKALSGTNLNPEVLFGTVYPTMMPVFWKYILLLIWPVGLSAFYDTTLYKSFFEPAVITSVLGWVAVFVLVFWKGSRKMKFWFLWAWLFFLPSANILPLPVYYADRYMYLPQIGFFVCMGLLISSLFAHFSQQSVKKIKSSLITYCLIFLIIAGFWGGMAFKRTEVWNNEISLWEDTAQNSPNIQKVRLNLGASYDVAGRLREAEQEYLAALSIYYDPRVEMNLKIVRSKLRMMSK